MLLPGIYYLGMPPDIVLFLWVGVTQLAMAPIILIGAPWALAAAIAANRNTRHADGASVAMGASIGAMLVWFLVEVPVVVYWYLLMG